jgi:Uma2 family endonuclease
MRPMPTPKITAEDVLRCESPWRDYEIWDGIPMVKEPCGGWSGAVGTGVVVPLGVFVKRHELGWTFGGDQGFLLARDPDRMLAPDAAFVSKERLPKLPRRGFIPMAPDFAVEVRSPTDAWEAVVEKCGVWLAHGAQCAWAIDPERFTIAVFRPGEAPEILTRTGAADARPALDGFTIDLGDLFSGLE